LSALFLSWASPESAGYYDPASLRPADKERASHGRGPKAERDWRVSRALIASLPAAHRMLSLSHSDGHALCASSNRHAQLGVDLERVMPRDILGLGSWVCNETEVAVLNSLDFNSDAQRDYFYMLWTVKEAFVKAANLGFPADMRSVGFEGAPGGTLQLRPPAGVWWAGVWRLAPGWMVALVGQGDAQEIGEPVWRAGPGASLPSRSCLGVWCGRGK
jgi:4'-phosphopantetheinyl transferase